MSGFFEEVKRRKVYRVAVAYIIIAGGIIQLASAAFPAWELPNWALRLVIVLLLMGFPIALVFAWIFDITPTGIERTSRVEPQTMPKSHRQRNMWILAASGFALAALAGFFLLPHASARKLDKSIAVLPFESFSDDKDSGYFADGVQDDILTNLAKIGDLKVISRTSVGGYRGKPGSVRDIGKTLGVSYLLEGSVRKANGRVRVNVQLINAQTDQHLWAEDYDRDLNDVFAIQTDLAQKIADELQAKLSPTEKAQITRKPTENGEAYLAFIQARNLFAPEDVEKLKQAEQLYDRALQLDPKFALAFAAYSIHESWLVRSNDPTPQRKQKARDLADKALALQPNLPEAHLALGYSYYYGDTDPEHFNRALREFEMAKAGLPNDSDVYLAIGAIQRRQGKWDDSTANLQKAVELDPNAAWPLQNLYFNFQMQRNFTAAKQTLDRALKLNPNSISIAALEVELAIREHGDVSVAAKSIERVKSAPPEVQRNPIVIIGCASLFILQRRFADAVRELESVQDALINTEHGQLGNKYLLSGYARLKSGDQAGARADLTKAKEFAESLIRSSPDVADYHCQLAQALAWLGEKEAAIAAAQRASQIKPEANDAFEGVGVTEAMARVYADVGESDRAIDLLVHLLQVPSDLTAQILKLDPAWDNLRSNPRFQQLIAKA